jgi:hypothetical protein
MVDFPGMGTMLGVALVIVVGFSRLLRGGDVQAAMVNISRQILVKDLFILLPYRMTIDGIG